MSTALASPPPRASRFRPTLELLSTLGFSAEVINQLTSAAQEVIADASLGAEFDRFRRLWPAQHVATPPFENSMVAALAVADAFPALMRRHEAMQLPFEVTAATLRDLERRIREYRTRTGEWGFDRLEWMRQHLAADLFALGRLQFVPGKWREGFDIYGGKAIGDIWAKAHSSPLQPLEQVPPCGYQLTITTGDPVLHVHIPSGPNFTPDSCRKSLQEARRFFARHFPETSFRAICCRTWLLDPALAEVLPPASNILGFGRLFRLLAVANATDKQHLDRIFGPGEDWRTFAPQTRLQKAAQSYLAKGGKFHLTAGFILWNDVSIQ